MLDESVELVDPAFCETTINSSLSVAFRPDPIGASSTICYSSVALRGSFRSIRSLIRRRRQALHEHLARSSSGALARHRGESSAPHPLLSNGRLEVLLFPRPPEHEGDLCGFKPSNQGARLVM